MTAATGQPAPEPAGARGFLGSVSARIVVVCVVVAVVAALVTIAVSVPLINGAAAAQAQANLDRLAGITVEALRQPSRAGVADRLRDLLGSQEVSAYLIGPDIAQAPGLTRAQVQAVLSGTELSTTVTVDGAEYFLSARPIDGLFGVVLLAPEELAVQPAAEGLRRLVVALLVGVGVASVLGYLVSRRLTRPLRQFARTAEELSAGRRDVRVEATGPQEVAEIARSLNHLSAALAASEDRQRQFLLSVSHELRTPLTAIRGYAEAMADGVVPPDELLATATVMQSEADRLDRLVADLLDLARLGAVDVAVHPADVDLVALAQEAAEVWRARCAREGVQFTAGLPPGPIPVRTDPVRARQIIDNLAENALRVTPAGAGIELSCGVAGANAVVEVRDSGPGLTEGDRAVAFEPAALYARYRGVRPVGSGVGLALVGRLAGRLGGSAFVAPATDGGAAFGVRLPRVLPPS